MQRSWLTILWLISTHLIWSQGVQWYVEVPRQAYVNGPFEVNFILENGQGKDLKFPAFQGFDVLAGPSVSNQYADINGVISRTITYGFQLRATKAGKITLGEASVVVNGKLYKTKAVTINIEKPDEAVASDTDAPALVRLKLSDHKIYKGQQLTAAYELYYRGSIGFEDAIQHPAFHDFSAKSLDADNEAIPGISVGGKQYEGILADAIALFPKKTGKLKIEPSYFPMKERLANNDPWSNPFGKYRSFQLVTKAEEVEVMPLPQPTPASFNGVVGKYEGRASLANEEVHRNQTINVRIEISGTGDPTTLSPPTLKLPSQLEAYPAKLLKEESKVQNQEWVHHHIWEVAVTASDTGRFDLEVVFQYFDTEKKAYTDLSLPELHVNVMPGEAIAVEGQTTLPEKKGINLYLLIGLLIIGSAVTAYFLLSKNKGQKLPIAAPKQDLAKVSHPGSQPIAEPDRFIKLESLLQQARYNKFYEALALTINEVLQNNLNLDKGQLNLENIKKGLLNAGKDDAFVEQYVQIRAALEAALYAGLKNGNEENLLAKSKTFVAQLENKIKKDDQ